MGVCVLGSINRDIMCRVSALPQPGETVSAIETRTIPGGKGANQAVASARTGAATRMIGAVGDDADGTMLTTFLSKETIDISGIKRMASEPTGAAFITLDILGENQIVVSPGANALVSGQHAVANIGESDGVFLAQLETPVAAIQAFFTAARAGGGRLILNAAPAIPEGAELFAQADIIIFNQVELAYYCGLPTAPRTADQAGVARILLTRPNQVVVVTLGGQGVALIDGSGITAIPGRRVPVVDTTGAGDCFCGTVAALIDNGTDLQRALVVANAAAALCVGRKGAAPAMPSLAEALAFADATT